ncbi:MAG: hypothetical protein IJT41_02985 [Clostridia bacterium]|nr:hypothetical protein [Clostridia bacterium]
MKAIVTKITAFLLAAVDLLVFGILPMPSLVGRGIATADDPIYLTAHRGVKAKAPENTIPAYQIAIDMGFYSVETDVHLTKDGVWVISHNDNIKKWYNGDAEIAETNYADLLKYRIKGGPGWLKYGTLRIPTLDEYLDLFIGTKSRPQIEIKTSGDDYKGIDKILEAVESRNLGEQALIISFDLGQLQYIRHTLQSDIELWYLCGEITQKEIDEAKTIGGNVWLSCNWEQNTVETMQKSVDAGIPVSMWTVDSLKDARMLYEAGFRYMETDRLAP